MNSVDTTILVVDDDRAIVDVLSDALASKKYHVVNASEAMAAFHQILTEKPDLIILDLSMPDLDGMILLGRIRKISDTPIIVLSARHEQADVVIALQSGADDFIRKPFELDDLFARCETVIRRVNHVVTPQASTEHNTFKSFSVSQSRGLRIDDVLLHTTPTEQRIISALISRQGETVEKQVMSKEVFGYFDDGSSHRIDVHVGRLRKKLKDHGCQLSIHAAGRGIGFYLGEPRYSNPCTN